jgi:chromosomal replication initiation ATPase DnaA
MSQFALALPHRTALGRADFLVGDGNRAALGWIERWPEWPEGGLVVHGPAGCGKTHLAHLWRDHTGGVIVAGAELVIEQALRLHGESGGRIAIDGAEAADEAALLHLYNLCRERRGGLLVTARRSPAFWSIALGDLASRLRALPSVAIEAPDDAVLGGVLVKHFADRQLRVTPEVIAHLVPRMERSFAAAATLAERLDRAALAEGRAVTIPLVRRVLAERGDHPSSPASDSGVR